MSRCSGRFQGEVNYSVNGNGFSKGQGRKIDVAARKNDAESWSQAIEAGGQLQRGDRSGAQQRGKRNRRRRLDDDFHALPDEASGRDNLFFTHEQNTVNVALKNGERARGKRGAKAVRDRV